MDRWNLYRKLREREQWVVDDHVLKQFPRSVLPIAHSRAWEFRMKSLRRFSDHLERNLIKGSRILDLGSGNGWISHALSLQGYRVLGLEPLTEDIDQARRVYGSHEHLQWHHGDLDSLPSDLEFDLILLAASIQYFSSLEGIILSLTNRLSPQGTVHVLDSLFYPNHEVEAARQRSQRYYEQIGFPEMAAYYYHHSIEVARALGFRRKWPNWPFSRSLQWWIRE